MAPLLKYCLLAAAVVLLFCMQVITAEVLCCVCLLLSYSSTLHLQGGPEKEEKNDTVKSLHFPEKLMFSFHF